jgi:hypothetical protein
MEVVTVALRTRSDRAPRDGFLATWPCSWRSASKAWRYAATAQRAQANAAFYSAVELAACAQHYDLYGRMGADPNFRRVHG